MRRSIAAVWLVVGTVIAHDAAARAPSLPDTYELRSSAWDRSVRLESEGKLAEARAVLLSAWGPVPGGYEVTVRLAWLSLRLGDSDRAIAWYEGARSLPGASREATQGLASAHAQRGYASLEGHDARSARKDFHAALALDPAQADARRGLDLAGPESHLDPELWLAYFRQSLPKARWSGTSMFAHLPWQVDDTWRLRFAYRMLASKTDLETAEAPAGGPRAGDVNTAENQNELYAGIRHGSPWVDFEALGAAVLPSTGDRAAGAGAQLRAGGRFGALVEGVSLRQRSGWNLQAIPALYYWPTDSVGLAAGTRVTSDTVGSALSAWAGLSLRDNRTELHVRAHRGTERWAFSIAQPSILTIDPQTAAGAQATALLPLSRALQLGLQAELDKLGQLAEPGIYFNVGLGVRGFPAL